MPPEAQAHTAAGAMAFVRYHFTLVDYAYETGDTAPLAAASDPACAPCAGVKDMIDATVRAGGSWEHETTTITQISVPDGEPVGAVNVLVTYSSETGREKNADGEVVRVFESSVDQQERLVLVPKGSSWAMFDYGEAT